MSESQYRLLRTDLDPQILQAGKSYANSIRLEHKMTFYETVKEIEARVE